MLDSTEINPVSKRLLSIDALRGFDMFWIIGGDQLIRAIAKAAPHPWTIALANQLEHREWEGFYFYDLIFPLFLFLVGAVLPFSLAKYQAEPKAAYVRIIRRGAMLFFLGLIANNLLQFDWENLRYAGVLQRIGICYAAAAIIFLNTKVRGQIIAILSILIGYWLLLRFVPNEAGRVADYSREGNIAGLIDRWLLPGKIFEEYYGFGDNEGLLSTIPAIATTLIGGLAGQLLRGKWQEWTKVGVLFAFGFVCLLLGYGWSLTLGGTSSHPLQSSGWICPLIKNIWTSSFVLVTAGWSLLLLACFYTLIDVLKWQRWSFFWIVIGCNAITIYIVQRIVDFKDVAHFFIDGVAPLFGHWQQVVFLTAVLSVKWLLLLFLYRNKIFMRL